MTTPHPEAPEADATPPGRKPKVGRYLVLGLVVLAAVAVSGILDRHASDAELTKWTDARAVTNVDLVSPTRATQDQHLTLPADIEAFYTAPIHSRVNGYVKMWYFDIGAHVKTGQVLARIDTPDLDQQYEQAKGELLRAQANYNLAVLTADRWKALRASNAVSQQTVSSPDGHDPGLYGAVAATAAVAATPQKVAVPLDSVDEASNFASSGYLAANPDVAKSGMDALTQLIERSTRL